MPQRLTLERHNDLKAYRKKHIKGSKSNKHRNIRKDQELSLASPGSFVWGDLNYHKQYWLRTHFQCCCKLILCVQNVWEIVCALMFWQHCAAPPPAEERCFEHQAMHWAITKSSQHRIITKSSQNHNKVITKSLQSHHNTESQQSHYKVLTKSSQSNHNT